MFYFGFLGNGSGARFIPGTVPKVISSTIGGDGSTIMVRFDRPMNLATDAHLALSAIKNGGAPIVPDNIIVEPQSPRTIGLVYAPDTFVSTDTIVWSYNDQHPTAKIKGAEVGGLEIDNQTYLVSNSISYLIHFKTPPKKVMDYWELTDIGDAPKMNGILHSANHVACTPTKYVDLPIIYTLGSEKVIGLGIWNKSVVTVSGETITFQNSGGDEWAYKAYLMEFGKSYLIDFTIDSITSGTVKIGDTYGRDGKNFISIKTVGNNTAVITPSVNSASSLRFMLRSQDTDAVVTINSVKEVNIPANSYATRYNVATKKFSQLTLPIASTYKMTIAFSQYLTHSKALTQADLDALDANPNLIADVWFNGVSLPSGFKKSDMVDYFGANEGKLNKLYNAKDGSVATIQAYADSVRDTYKNVSFGVQNFFLEQDASGRTTASHDQSAMIGGTDGRYLKIDSKKQLITKASVTTVKGNVVGSLTES